MAFNEGGADCPPRRGQTLSSTQTDPTFNEGGADCPPRQQTPKERLDMTAPSMKGGRTAPRDLEIWKIARWLGRLQ